MNSVEKISRLQTLLTRVQTRSKEPHEPAPVAVAPAAAPVAAAPAPAPVAVVPAAPVAPIAITPPAAPPKIVQPEPELRPAAVFAPAATSVSTDTTLPFSARVAPEVIARAGMKSPLGSEPPEARIELPATRTEPAPAPTRESAPPEIEMGEAEEMISEAPPKVIEVVPAPEKPAKLPEAALSELDFADLESPEPLEAEKPGEAEEAPPASSKRPSLHAREPAPEPERPVTAPPESGPQELSAAELGAAAKAEPLEVDLALKEARVPREATMEQLGNTVELEEATEEALELAPTEAPAIRQAEPAGEMEAEIPASIPPGVYGPDVARVRVEPAQTPAEPAPAEPAQTPAEPSKLEAMLELEELGPVSEKAPPAEAEAPREPITAVRLIVPAAKAEPVPVTIDVRPVAAPGAVLQAEAAAFVGAVRSFYPGSFLDLLDASLSLDRS